jgi:hypothetical protein
VPASALTRSGDHGAAPAARSEKILRTARNIRSSSNGVEPPKNGLAEPQIRRRLARPDGASRTTPGGFSHSPAFGLRDSHSSPKTHPGSSSRPTPNGYHDNGSAGSTNDSNSPPTANTGKAARRRTAWELPKLIQPLHRPRTNQVKRPRLLPHYPAVIEFVYHHRYATGFQIQRRFNGYMANERTRQYHLATLVELRYLRQAPVRSTSPNFPAIYAATRQGIGLVRRTYADLGIAWKGTFTEQLKSPGLALDSVLHEVMLTEFDLALREAVESREEIELLMHERRYFQVDRRLEYDFDGERQCLMPDAGFLLRLTCQTPEGPSLAMHRLQLNFLEFDNGTMSAARLAKKYSAYQQWSVSSSGRQYLHRLFRFQGGISQQPNFRLLVLARDRAEGGDDRRLAELFALALDLPRNMRDRIWLATVANLQRHHDERSPLAKPLWIRVRDARNWIPKFKQINGHNPSAHIQRKTAFVSENLALLPRHVLLPVEPTNVLPGIVHDKEFS